ncbi:MAG: MraY family glycosyltransferase, partial [Fervidobacterium sp.]
MNSENFFNLFSDIVGNTLFLEVMYTLIILFYSIILIIISRGTGILLEYPDDRKNHKKPVPLIGGTVLFVTILSLSNFGMYDKIILKDPIFYLIFLVGFMDDLLEVPYYIKLILQFIPGIIFANTNPIVFPNLFHNSIFNILSENEFLWKVLSFLLFIIIVNAFNLIDGVNGLLLGISLIYSVLSLDFKLTGILLILLTLNFNELLFMGDSGAFLIAYLLLKKRVLSSDFIETSVFFGYPLYEIASSFLRRLVFRQNPFKPDRFHLHHIGIEKFGITIFLINAYMLTLGFSLISTQKFGVIFFIITFLVLFSVHI